MFAGVNPGSRIFLLKILLIAHAVLSILMLLEIPSLQCPSSCEMFRGGRSRLMLLLANSEVLAGFTLDSPYY